MRLPNLVIILFALFWLFMAYESGDLQHTIEVLSWYM